MLPFSHEGAAANGQICGALLMTFGLKLASGKVVTWAGASGEDADLRYVDAHRDQTVVAWRHARHGLYVGVREVVEPGHYL